MERPRVENKNAFGLRRAHHLQEYEMQWAARNPFCTPPPLCAVPDHYDGLAATDTGACFILPPYQYATLTHSRNKDCVTIGAHNASQ